MLQIPNDSKGILERRNPTPNDVAHCILYVIKATTNLSEESSSKTIMKELIEKHNKEGNDIRCTCGQDFLVLESNIALR